jgi:hypothetical protein
MICIEENLAKMAKNASYIRYWPHDLLVRFQQLVLIVVLVCKF